MATNSDFKEVPPGKEPTGGIIRRFFRIFGIHFPYTHWYRVYISGHFFVFLSILAAIFIVFMALMYNYSTKPGFCRICHIMEPYYQAWDTSTHKEVATCVTCHYPPTGSVLPMKARAVSQVVQYVTRTYRPRPHAVVKDENCLQKGCHETRLLDGKITMRGGEVQFDHTPHLTQIKRGKQLRCTSCHSQIMVGTHIEVTLSSCYNCHFKGHKPGRTELPLAGCRKCHLPPSKSLDLGEGLTFNHADYIDREGVQCIFCHLDSVKGDGPAPQERCFACHNTPDRMAKYDDIEFIHQKHVSDRSVECQACHIAIEHKIHAAEPSEGTCNQCHQPSHNAVYMMFDGEWPGLDQPQPSTMARTGLHCIACHEHPSVENPQQNFMPINWTTQAEACDTCHGEGFGEFIDAWKTDLNDALARIDKLVAELEAHAGSLVEDDPGAADLKALLKKAKTESAFARYGNGVHNYDLASARLAELEKALSQALPKPADQ